jgi:hypothetical protein
MINGYPDKVNETCGLHVHISVPTVGAYEALATERFYNFMKFSLRVWAKKNKVSSSHRFWHRLAGKNTYCEDNFQPEDQIFDTYKSSARYAIINYCFSCHGTMEVRVLPMFDKPKLAVSAVKNILWTTNKFLSLPGIYSGNPGGSAIEEVVEMDIDHEMLNSFLVNV